MTVTTLPLTRPTRDPDPIHPDPALACLPATVDVAPTAAERCDHAEGGLPCVRRPHPEHPHAHVRVAGSRCNALAARDEPRGKRLSIAS